MDSRFKNIHEFISKIQTPPQDVWGAFEKILGLKKIAKGNYFIQLGESSREFGFVGQGLLRKFYISEDGKEFTKGFAQQGQLVAPYISLISKGTAEFSIGALEDCELIVVNYDAFEALIKESIWWQETTRKVTEKIIAERERRSMQLLMLSANERYEAFKKDFPDLHQRLPQYHIASYLGITPVALSRMLSKQNASGK